MGGEIRCHQCCQEFRREQDLKAHGLCKWRERSKVGSRAEQCVLRDTRARVVAERGTVAVGRV